MAICSLTLEFLCTARASYPQLCVLRDSTKQKLGIWCRVQNWTSCDTHLSFGGWLGRESIFSVLKAVDKLQYVVHAWWNLWRQPPLKLAVDSGRCLTKQSEFAESTKIISLMLYSIRARQVDVDVSFLWKVQKWLVNSKREGVSVGERENSILLLQSPETLSKIVVI